MGGLFASLVRKGQPTSIGHFCGGSFLGGKYVSEQDKNVKLSDNERLKRESNFLRGTIEQDLKDEITGGFTADNFQLIRFHGMYQQDDRDIRPER